MKMFGLFALILSALFFSFSANAQNRIGFIGGLNVASIANLQYSIEDARVTNRAGLGFGVFADHALNESVALRVESMFLQKGGTIGESFYDPVAGVINVDLTFDLSYLESAILLKIGAGGKETQTYFMAGPTVGYLIDARMTSKINGRESNAEPPDLTRFFKNIDVGINAGAGLRLGAFFVEGRYIASLSNILADPQDGDSEWMNRGLELMAGISAPIGR